MMVNVAVIHAVIMGIVIFDLYTRQKEFVQKELLKKGSELSYILSSNAVDAMLRDDIAALQELMGELLSVKEVKTAFILDANGRVRASTNDEYFNLTLSDEPSKALLKEARKGVAQKIGNGVIDTATPITVQKNVVGYVRIILNKDTLDGEINAILYAALSYALMAVIAGSLLAFAAIRKMGEDIDKLANAAKKISAKEFDSEIPLIKGKSEIAQMSQAFIVMMDSIRQNIRELERTEKEMEIQATRDALTGLSNRASFERALNLLIDESKSAKTSHALLFLDLDRFKIVNDTAGHLAGDRLLKEVAKLMQECIRKEDMLFRFGGDEFGIILKNCDLAHAKTVGEKLINSIDSYELYWEEATFRVGASIGAVAIDENSKDALEALSLADAACYIAKDKGRNRVFIASKDDKESMEQKEEMSWVAKIQDALLGDKFELYVQKIESLKDGLSDHHEVLLRLNKPNGEIALPCSFLPAAERYALMPDIDLWVTKRLFSKLSSDDFTKKSGKFCINLSGQSINDDGFLPELKKILEDKREIAQNIVFEITESVAITNHVKASAFIADLREFNCLFALDDFGSGNSSFTYLKNFSVDYLKIDGSFVKNIFESKIDETFVEAVASIADKTGMLVVAEYVENEAIRKKMEEMGVHYAQGFGVEEPFPMRLMV